MTSFIRIIQGMERARFTTREQLFLFLDNFYCTVLSVNLSYIIHSLLSVPECV